LVGGLLSVYYGLLPYCKTMRWWLAAGMSGGATDGEAAASPWHQMPSRTCCRVRNAGSGRPRHVISTCTGRSDTSMFRQFRSVTSAQFSAVIREQTQDLHR